jgi:heat-inducible transcriptional repressor
MNDYFSTSLNNATITGQGADRLDVRMRNIFTRIVDLYLETGSPVGSKSIAVGMDHSLSPSSIRSIMAELEQIGLLYQPHASAGRMPTESGLRLFVNGLMELGGDLSEETRSRIDSECLANGLSFTDALTKTTSALSGLSHCASLVISPTADAVIRHVEFVPLGKTKALVVIVTGSGQVENRIITLPAGLPTSALIEAGNFLSTTLAGSTLSEADGKLRLDIETRKAEIDNLARKVVDTGLAIFSGDQRDLGTLILKGHANLLKDVTASDDVEKISRLFTMLEAREHTMNLLEAVQLGSGVQIFIGAENDLFKHTDCTMIIAPYQDNDQQIVGAVGVIGPRRMNYARIIPLVDYTSEAISKMLSQ